MTVMTNLDLIKNEIEQWMKKGKATPETLCIPDTRGNLPGINWFLEHLHRMKRR